VAFEVEKQKCARTHRLKYTQSRTQFYACTCEHVFPQYRWSHSTECGSAGNERWDLALRLRGEERGLDTCHLNVATTPATHIHAYRHTNRRTRARTRTSIHTCTRASKHHIASHSHTRNAGGAKEIPIDMRIFYWLENLGGDTEKERFRNSVSCTRLLLPISFLSFAFPFSPRPRCNSPPPLTFAFSPLPSPPLSLSIFTHSHSRIQATTTWSLQC